MAAPKIFISYSHKDEKWKEMLLIHLRSLERMGLVEIWDTSSLQPGDDWAREIATFIKNADVAVLLLSADFLASDFIVGQEFPLLLEQSKQRGLVVLPVLIRPSAWTAVPELAQFHFLNDPARPLANLSESERDYAFASIAQKLTKLTQALNERDSSKQKPDKPKASTTASPTGEATATVKKLLFVSHSKVDGDFAELLKLKLERDGYSVWIDVDRLGPGVDWRQEIDEGIKNSKALIAVMSPEARESEYVTYEWAFAWGTGVKIIPVMLRQTTMHPRLATLQYLDFTNRIARPWSKLLSAVGTNMAVSDNLD